MTAAVKENLGEESKQDRFAPLGEIGRRVSPKLFKRSVQ